MRALSLPNGSREQLTFSITITILGVIAAAQVIALIYYQTHRSHFDQRAANQQSAETRLFPLPKPFRTPATVTVPAVEGIPQATVTRPGKAPKSVPETLLRVAKGYRDRGDTANAIVKLQQAIALDPGNPEVLADLALIYESMQLLNRSNEVWRRLQSLGPTAGPLYQLAELKLQVGVPAQVTVAAAGSSATVDGTQLSNSNAVPDGSTFGISEVTLKRESDPEAETRLLLRVGVKVRPETTIDHTKIKIQVFFYDMLNNDQVVLTNADVSYEWVTPGHDWAATGTEVLDVTYYRPKRSDPIPGSPLTDQQLEVPDSVEKAKRAARNSKKGAELLPTNENGPREYLGYIVQVYYKEQLQAVRADPTRLLNLFPPPLTAPPQ